MTHYIATFHTHLAALRTHRSLADKGLSSQMTPVPRKLSSSCGTCVRYQSVAPELDSMDRDTEAVYEDEGGEYTLVHGF